jgi:ankyrin repeat protein
MVQYLIQNLEKQLGTVATVPIIDELAIILLSHTLKNEDFENIEDLIQYLKEKLGPEATVTIINRADEGGKFPLQRAVECKKTKVVKWLVEYVKEQLGLEAAIAAIHNQALLRYAVENDNLKLLQWLTQYYVGHDIYRADVRGKTPLHYAAEKGYFRIVHSLTPNPLAIDVINCADREGNTPLHCAAKSGSLKIVQWLAEKLEKTEVSAAFERRNIDGKTPLECIAKGNPKTVEWLTTFLKNNSSS